MHKSAYRIFPVLMMLWTSILLIDSKHAHAQDLYGLSFPSIDGKTMALKNFRGQVLLVVNTASQCGYTSQYEGLQKLYLKYREKGFQVIGVPSKSFNQEYDDNKKVAEFCKFRYGVTFPLTKIVSVKGDDQHPVYQYLTERSPSSIKGEVKWNFEKFLIDRQGQVQNRFRSGVSPEDPKLVQAIETLLSSEKGSL